MQIMFTTPKVVLAGNLTEALDEAALHAALQAAGGEPQTAPVQVDLARVERVNSMGLMKWARCSRGYDLRLHALPNWLVPHFNMIPDLLGPRSRIESVEALFVEEATKRQVSRLMVIGRDVPLVRDLAEWAPEARSDEGTPLAPEFEPDEFFEFVTRDLEKYGGAFP